MLITFPYVNRDTPIHRLDPRTKLIVLFAFIFSVTQTSNFWFILVGLIIAAFYYSQAHLTWSETKWPWIIVIALTIAIVGGNYILSGGSIVRGVDIGRPHVLYMLPFIGLKGQAPFVGPAPLIVSVESIFFLLTQIMRNISVALLVFPVAYTIDPAHIGIAFRKLGVPDKIAYAIDLSLRFLPSIARDFLTTFNAQRARGFELDKLRGGLFGKIARLAPMVVPVVIGSIVGAEDIISAMELRCFGVGRRTWLIELHARPIDRLLITLAIGGFIVISLLDIAGYFVSDGILHVLHTQGIPRFLVP